VRHPEIALRLVAANSGTGTQGAVGLGLEMQLAPGWKTYWRSPGDAGLPPTIDWAGSDNLANAALRFPVPERFTLFGLETYGYGGTVILPIEAALHTPGEALRVRAGVDVLRCLCRCAPSRLCRPPIFMSKARRAGALPNPSCSFPTGAGLRR